MADTTDAELLVVIKRMFLKTTEILSMMKKGEFIIAYEKLGGVLKNIDAIGVVIEKRLNTNEEKPLQTNTIVS